MATITGLTAAAMTAIRNGMVVGAHIDSANHIILEKYDGTTVDGGVLSAANTAQPGIVELATSAETLAGTDTSRAVTPAGLASIPGNKVQLLGTVPAESATPASYPTGISHMILSGTEGWSINSSVGSVITNNPSADRCQQTFYSNPGGTGNPRSWMRYHHTTNNGGGWTSWRQVMIMNELTTASFSQSTAFSSYPSGISRMYFTTTSSTGWDFAGLAGEIETYSDGLDFARQTFTSHVGGTSNKPVRWFRTANTASGWTNWQFNVVDQGAWTSWTPTWTTSSGIHLPSFGTNSTLSCSYTKYGRKVDARFEITFGSTATFGTSAATTDNWQFSLPVPAARSGDSIGWVMMAQTNNLTAMARVRTNSTTTFLLGIASGRVDAATIINTGDVDSLSPWTWGSGDSVKGNLVYESAS